MNTQLATLEYTEAHLDNIYTTLETKEDYLPWQTMGLSYTATGYGHKIPTTYKVKHNNRWKRVYCRVFGNSGSLYIISGNNQCKAFNEISIQEV